MANIKITNYKIKSKVNKTVVLISDIHYYSRKDLNKLENIDLKFFEENEVFLINSDINKLLRGLNE